jgi:hypothetical protein
MDRRISTSSADLDSLVDRIRGEFNEMPGLQLTEAPAARLWGVEAADAVTSSTFL